MKSGSLVGVLPACATQSVWGAFRNNVARYWKLLGIHAKRPSRMLQLQETLSLGEKRSLAIVRCGDERILIGSAQGSVSLLSALPKRDPAFEDALRHSQAIEASK